MYVEERKVGVEGGGHVDSAMREGDGGKRVCGGDHDRHAFV